MIRYFNRILTIALIFCTISIDAQKWKLTRYELQGGIGSANYFGDIGGSADQSNLYGLKDIRLRETGPSLYGGAWYRLNPSFSFKFNFIYGYLQGSDIGSKNESRGVVFRSHVMEPSLQVEYAILSDVNRSVRFARFSRRGMLNTQKLYRLYAFTGVGELLYFPKILESNGEIPAERVSGYSNYTTVIPVGLGLSFNILTRLSMGVEVGGRYSFSDHLDGYTTPFSKFNDVYYFFSATLGYKFRTNRNGYPIIFPKGVPRIFGGKK